MTRKIFTACSAALACFLSACAVGPNFKKPDPPRTAGFTPSGAIPAQIGASATPGQAQRLVEGLDIQGQWWTLFQSPALNELIERALNNSPTLEAATAALQQARETLAAERGSYYPSLSAAAGVQRQKVPGAAFGAPQIPSIIYTLNNATLNISYTLDPFGGIRRQVESLGAQAEYQRYALEAAYLSLTANLVTAAITEASLRAQLAATQEIADSQRQQLDITQRRFDAGGASRADILQQQAVLQSTLAGLPALRTLLAQQRNLLATYAGTLPADYTGPEFTLDTLTLPVELPLSVPSKFVEQRPDVREYSELLHAATAQIGVATANMLPQITLVGQLWRRSDEFFECVLTRLRGLEPGGLRHPAVVQRRAIIASTPRRGGRRAAGGRQLSRHGHHGFSKCFRYAVRAQRRCRGRRNAGARGAHRFAELESGPSSVPKRRRQLSASIERGANLSIGCSRADQSEGAALRRYGRFIPGARRRLVEPQRRRRQPDRFAQGALSEFNGYRPPSGR